MPTADGDATGARLARATADLRSDDRARLASGCEQGVWVETVREGETLIRRGPVAVTAIGPDAGIDAAGALLDGARSHVGAPLVDEAERSRLRDLDDREGHRAPRWHPLLAEVDGEPTGYAGIALPLRSGELAEGDLAPDRRRTSHDDTVSALFAALVEVGRRGGAGRLRVWIRHATDADGSSARREGFGVERRLAVMGRGLAQVPEPDLPPATRVRSFEPGADETDVVEVLREAYRGTPEAGWDRDRFDERRSYDWFDPDDLLVARDADGVAGVHWTKRRGDGVGEVYNLAVLERARGGGLGRALLRAGLRHLAGRGCDEVILWVDSSNGPAVRLYTSEGFTERWEDVAFGRDLR